MRQTTTTPENRLQLEPFFTKQDVANYLGVSTRTISRWIADRKIGYHRFGGKVKFSAKQISDFVNSAKQKRKL